MEHNNALTSAQLCSSTTHSRPDLSGNLRPGRPPPPEGSEVRTAPDRRICVHKRKQPRGAQHRQVQFLDLQTACGEEAMENSPLPPATGGAPRIHNSPIEGAEDDSPLGGVRPRVNQCGWQLRHMRDSVSPSLPSTVSRPPLSKLRGQRLRRGLQIQEPNPDEPTLDEVLNSVNVDEWLIAMHDEYQSLVDHGTFSIVPRPRGVHVIKGKWVRLAYMHIHIIYRYMVYRYNTGILHIFWNIGVYCLTSIP
jgi:hypothetical protein